MKNLRNITKYIDVKNFKARPLEKAEETLLTNKLTQFSKSDHKLSHTFQFPKDQYPIVLERMNQIGRIADQMDHHPEWTLTADSLKVDLNTHEIKNISEKDYLLAFVVESLMKDLPDEQRLLSNWGK